MKFSPEHLDVEPTGDEDCYWVESSDPAIPYKVDMGTRWPMGQCNCRDYDCRRWPEWKKAHAALKPCKHILAVYVYCTLYPIHCKIKAGGNQRDE